MNFNNNYTIQQTEITVNILSIQFVVNEESAQAKLLHELEMQYRKVEDSMKYSQPIQDVTSKVVDLFSIYKSLINAHLLGNQDDFNLKTVHTGLNIVKTLEDELLNEQGFNIQILSDLKQVVFDKFHDSFTNFNFKVKENELKRYEFLKAQNLIYSDSFRVTNWGFDTNTSDCGYFQREELDAFFMDNRDEMLNFIVNHTRDGGVHIQYPLINSLDKNIYDCYLLINKI